MISHFRPPRQSNEIFVSSYLTFQNVWNHLYGFSTTTTHRVELWNEIFSKAASITIMNSFFISSYFFTHIHKHVISRVQPQQQHQQLTSRFHDRKQFRMKMQKKMLRSHRRPVDLIVFVREGKPNV